MINMCQLKQNVVQLWRWRWCTYTSKGFRRSAIWYPYKGQLVKSTNFWYLSHMICKEVSFWMQSWLMTEGMQMRFLLLMLTSSSFDFRCRTDVPEAQRKNCNIPVLPTYEGWNFNFGNAAVTSDTAHLQSSYFHRPSMYSPKLCRTRSQRWRSRMMPLAAPLLLMVRTERSTAEGLNPPYNCPIR